jgi:hypothetical protein
MVEYEYARCAESFWNRVRFDVILVKPLGGKFVIARLHFLFSCRFADRPWRLALVTCFKTVKKPADSNIGLRQVREDTMTTRLILADSIVRLLYPSPVFEQTQPNDYFILDTHDTDTYLRLSHIPDELIE